MMKKMIIATLLATAALSFTACGDGGKSGYQDSIGSTSNQTERKIEGESKAEDGTSGGEDLSSLKPVYGKVSSITGNELDFSLAKDPYDGQEKEGGERDVFKMERGGAVAVEMAPSVEVKEVVIDEGEAPKMKLEYTGKSKSYTIPAGVKIYGLTGEEIQLENLKKGNVLMVMMNGDTVSEIAVLE